MTFQNFENLINKIEKDLGIEFNDDFRESRKKLAGLTNLPNRIIFSEFDKNKSEWVFNRGGKKEIQYHIFLRNNEIGYGLGFNSQRGTFNNDDPAEIANLFGNSFKDLYNEICKILPTYTFKIGSQKDLGKMQEGEFLLFGNTIPVGINNYIADSDYKGLLSNLKKQLKIYCEVFKLTNLKKAQNLQKEKQMEELNEKLDILRYKKQIILQGPPGTGKTRKAKELLNEILENELNKELNELYFNKIFKIGFQFYLKNGKVASIQKIEKDKMILDIRNESKEVSFTSQQVYDCYKNTDFEEKDFVDFNKYVVRSVVIFIIKILKKEKIKNQFKIIQFHPSYTYEDFVRGISAKPNKNGSGILYEAENKTLGEFAQNAFKNYQNSKKTVELLSLEKWVEKMYNDFKNSLELELEKSGELTIKEGTIPKIVAVEENAFRVKRYSNENDSVLIKDSDIIFGYIGEKVASPKVKIKENSSLSKSARSGMYYLYQNLILKFEKYLLEEGLTFGSTEGEIEEKLKNYVLVIDEINRANLSSVLGELIYALEYRGEEVESMYEVEGSQKLILPPNLYIIGTMNTADRSVGHIDYAIRRRFAFVDVLPKNLESELKDDFKGDVFAKVASLFIENYDSSIDYSDENVVIKKSEYMTGDFDPKDVWLGHSYFIQHYEKNEIDENVKEKPVDFSFRIRYEIKPILEEYIKDGILKESARSVINSL